MDHQYISIHLIISADVCTVGDEICLGVMFRAILMSIADVIELKLFPLRAYLVNFDV